MPLVERNHPIETLAPSGADESLAVPIGLRRADGCLQHAQRHGVQCIVNREREDAVAIVHEEAIGPIEGKAIPELLDGPPKEKAFDAAFKQVALSQGMEPEGLVRISQLTRDGALYDTEDRVLFGARLVTDLLTIRPS